MQSINEKTIWHEGLLLAPQHLQAQARYHDAQLHTRLAALTRWAWGIVVLKVDETALDEGTLQIYAAQVVLPSGLTIAWDTACGQAPVCRALSQAAAYMSQTPLAADGSRRLDIYLGVAQERDGVANVAVDAPPQTHQRYRGYSRMTAEHTFAKTPPVEVLLAAPHVQLLFGQEIGGELEVIHIGQLVLGADGAWHPDAAFAPAALRLHHHSHFITRLEHVVRRLRRSAELLVPVHRQSADAQSTPRWSDIVSLLQLRALDALIPLLEHILADQSISPREAYGLLKQALALGAPLLATRTAPFVAYQHVTQHAWLQPFVRQLEAMAPAPRAKVTALPLEPLGPDRWQAVLPTTPLSAGGQFILEVPIPQIQVAAQQQTAEPADAAQHLARRWARQAKLAAPQKIDHLLRSALLGVELTALQSLPDGVYQKADHIYLRLELAHPEWRDVQAAGAVAIVPPRAQSNVQQAKLLCIAFPPAGAATP